jgi:hypothetical protein
MLLTKAIVHGILERAMQRFTPFNFLHRGWAMSRTVSCKRIVGYWPRGREANRA